MLFMTTMDYLEVTLRHSIMLVVQQQQQQQQSAACKTHIRPRLTPHAQFFTFPFLDGADD